MTRPTLQAYELIHQGAIALAQIESAGIRLNTRYLRWASSKLTERITHLEEKLRKDKVYTAWRKRFGDRANLGSLPQLAEVLYVELKHPYKGDKTKTGRFRADEESLYQVDLPFVKRYGNLSKLKKLQSTYVKGLLKEVGDDGYLHPFFDLHTVRTYRSSSSHPNWQNLPIRDPFQGKVIRQSIIPRDGHCLVEIDFGALEFRVASCVVGGTLIETIDGPQIIKDVIMRVRDEEDVYVYGYDHAKGRIAVSRVLEGGRTRKKAKVWKVTLDNGKTITATADHKFMLRAGEYRELKNLKVGDSLMPFYKERKPSHYKTVYDRIYLNNGDSLMAHNLIALDVFGVQIKGSNKVVHHWDGNGTNNSLDNIEVMTRRRHMKIHSVQGWENHRKGVPQNRNWWQKSEAGREHSRNINRKRKETWSEARWAEWRKRLSEGIKRRGGHGGSRNGMYGKKQSESAKMKMALKKKGKVPKTAGWNKGLTKETNLSVRKISESTKGRPAWNKGKKGGTSWNKGLKTGPLSAEAKAKMSRTLTGRKDSAETRKKKSEYRKKWWENNRLQKCPICGKILEFLPSHMIKIHSIRRSEYTKKHNHKITKIEFVGREDVYNITVEGIHNYATEAGVVIKNCFWRDPGMIAYAKDPNKDIHRDYAAKIFLCSKEQAKDKPLRNQGKAGFVFPYLYGSYWLNIARSIWENSVGFKVGDVPVREWLASKGIFKLGNGDSRNTQPGTFEHHIRKIQDGFDRAFPVFVRSKEKWISDYKKTGGFPLVTGFWVEGLYSNNNLLNYPIQGPGFHCLLWSLIELQKWLVLKEMKTKIVGQIHDSIIADVHLDELQIYLTKARKIMTKDIRKAWDWLIVPLEVEVLVSPPGKSWHDKKLWIEKDGVWGAAE